VNRKPPLRLCFSGLIYQFETKLQLKDWVDVNMAYSEDRRQLYEAIMSDSYTYVLQIVRGSTPDSETDSIAVLKSLKVISEDYGPTYDPHQEVFKLEEDTYRKLEI